MEITDFLGLIFRNVNAQFRRNIPGVTRRSAKRILYSDLGFASRIRHHKFMLHITSKCRMDVNVTSSNVA